MPCAAPISGTISFSRSEMGAAQGMIELTKAQQHHSS